MQQDNYGHIAKFFHWSIAILIILNYILGLTLDSNSLYNVHKQTGLTILVLVILRILWHIVSKYPKQLSSLSPLEKAASVSMHMLLYILMASIPIGGILMTQSFGYPVTLWGIYKLPMFISPQPKEIVTFIANCHKWGAHAIIILASLHALAALKHYFINKDHVLQRMLPFSQSK